MVAIKGFVSSSEKFLNLDTKKVVKTVAFELIQDGKRVNFTRDPMMARSWETKKLGLVNVVN